MNKHSQQPASNNQPATASNSQPASTDITSMFNYGDYGDDDDYGVNPRLKKLEKLASAKVNAKVKASTKNLRTVGNNYKQFVTTQSTPQEASWDWNGSFDPDLETYDVIVFTVFLEDYEYFDMLYPITWW